MIRHLRPFVITLCLLTLLAPLPRPVAAQEATPEAACVSTSPEENKALVTAYWDEAVWGKQGKIAELVAPDEVHHWGLGGDSTGFDEFSARWATFNTAFPDLRFTVDLVAAADDLAATRWTATGTQSGEWQGIPPTNKAVTWSGINVFRIACGKIAESWGNANHLGLLAQLGAPGIPAFLAEAAAAATPAAAGAATPCASDSPEANQALVERWTNEVWTGKDLDVLDEIAAPDIVHHGAAFPDAHGVAALKEAIGGQLAAFPDISLTVDAAFADGNLVVVRWSGTATDAGEYMGLPPSGQQTELRGINIYRVSCGRIVESWSEFNGLDILRSIQAALGTPTP